MKTRKLTRKEKLALGGPKPLSKYEAKPRGLVDSLRPAPKADKKDVVGGRKVD